jgi:hypothetical protein
MNYLFIFNPILIRQRMIGQLFRPMFDPGLKFFGYPDAHQGSCVGGQRYHRLSYHRRPFHLSHLFRDPHIAADFRAAAAIDSSAKDDLKAGEGDRAKL